MRSAVAFLTRIPVGRRSRPFRPERSVGWFPVVGALVGAAAGAVYAVAAARVDRPLAAMLAVGVPIALTGALHEDGLADTADALGSRTGADGARRILKDPRLGTFGVIALAGALALRTAAVASLPVREAFAALVSVHAASRAGMVVLLLVAAPAADGLGAGFARRTTWTPVLIAVFLGAAIALAGLGAAAAAVVVAVVVAVVAWLRRLAVRRLGGATGDVAGAAEQLIETVALVALAAFAPLRPLV